MSWRVTPSMALAALLISAFAVPARAQSTPLALTRTPFSVDESADQSNVSLFGASMVVRFDRPSAGVTHARPILVRVRVIDQGGIGQNGAFSPAGIPKPKCTALKGILVGAAAGTAVGWVGGLLSEPHNDARAHNILADMAVGAVAGGVVGWLLCGR